MSIENQAKRERVKSDANRELRRIVELYYKGRILDDGVSDALAYASSLLNYSREWGVDGEYDRWRATIDAATRPTKRSFEELRKEILSDSSLFLKAGKGDAKLAAYGIALQNLAYSF